MKSALIERLGDGGRLLHRGAGENTVVIEGGDLMKNLILAAAGVALLAVQSSAAQSPAPQANPWFPDLAVTQLRVDQVQGLKSVGSLVGGCVQGNIGRLLAMSDQVRGLMYEEGVIRQGYARTQCPVITQSMNPDGPNPDVQKIIDHATPNCRALYQAHLDRVYMTGQFNDGAGRLKNDFQTCFAQMTLAATNTCDALRRDFQTLPSPSSSTSVAQDILTPFAGAAVTYTDDQMRSTIRQKMTDLGCPDIP